MSKVDVIFKKNIEEIMNSGCLDENPRPVYEDGTPAHTKFITHVFETYDLSKGEFPITTLRPIAWRNAINEILAIYQTQTNTQEGFESHSVTWWKPWMNNDGNIGRAYSYNLESHRPDEMKKTVVKIKKRILGENEYIPLETGLINDIEESIDGKIYKSNYRDYGEYILIDKFTKKNPLEIKSRSYYKVQFLNNGFITDFRADLLLRGQHPMNHFVRTLNGIGYLGDYKKVKNFSKVELKKLHRIWSGMIKRCYDGTRQTYENTYVSNNWHSFENFLKDIRYIPQYHLAKECNFKGWNLDKDYFGSNCYSKETCVFLPTQENTIYRSTQSNPFKFIIDDKEYVDLTYTSVANSLNVGSNTLSRWVDNGKSPDGNVKFENIDTEKDYVYRYELSRNQINELIKGLKEDKYSRRHMISFFNWPNQDKKMLVECAFETIWSVRKCDDEYYLDCLLTQRSSDYLTAGHINKIQYVALQMMLAHECGYKVGKFSHSTACLHIYDKHYEQAEELLKRDIPKSQPRLILNAKNKGFYEISISDFTMENYNPVREQLKFPLGI